MCGRQLPAVQQAPAQTQYQQPYQQPMYPAGPAPVQPQYQQAPQPAQYQQQPYQQAQYQQPAMQQQAPQPMMQQPGKPKKNMMLIAILAIVAVVIVIVAIVLLMGLGGSGSALSIVGTPDDTNVNAFYWASNSGVVDVDVTVKNNAAVATSGTINVKIVSTMPVLGTKYTSEGSKAITLGAGAQQTFTVDVSVGTMEGAMLIYSTVTTVTIT
jgi:flagellar basal body-associated protein FliL